MMRPARLPSYVPLRMIITGGYLTIEVPFSAHLLDVLGGNPSSGDIARIEEFGRILTGAAVAIAIFGWLLARAHARAVSWKSVGLRKPSFVSTVFRSLVTATAFGASTFFALDDVPTYIGNGSSPEQRKKAFVEVMARHAVKPSALSLDGIPEPAWKAFRSIAPSFSGSEGLSDISGIGLAALAAAEAARRIGEPAAFPDEFFGSRFDPVRTAYLNYKRGSDQYREAVKGVDRTVADGWKQYLTYRKRAGYEQIYRQQELDHLRRGVRERGVPIPANWHPDDRRGFEAAYRGEIMKKIDTSYADAVASYLGKGARLPIGLDFAGFLESPRVQERIRKDADLSSGALIRPRMTDKEFEAAVFSPLKSRTTDDLIRMAKGPSSDFADGGPHEEAGRNAVQMAIIPFMAILLSLLGALLHICKLIGYLIQFFGHLAGISVLTNDLVKWTAALVFTCAAAYAITPSSMQTGDNETYAQLAGDGFGSLVKTATIAIQPGFQPLGRQIGNVGVWPLIGRTLPQPN